jgi:hypothetical protein
MYLYNQLNWNKNSLQEKKVVSVHGTSAVIHAIVLTYIAKHGCAKVVGKNKRPYT